MSLQASQAPSVLGYSGTWEDITTSIDIPSIMHQNNDWRIYYDNGCFDSDFEDDIFEWEGIDYPWRYDYTKFIYDLRYMTLRNTIYSGITLYTVSGNISASVYTLPRILTFTGASLSSSYGGHNGVFSFHLAGPSVKMITKIEYKSCTGSDWSTYTDYIRTWIRTN